jgi:hypothetical protein
MQLMNTIDALTSDGKLVDKFPLTESHALRERRRDFYNA